MHDGDCYPVSIFYGCADRRHKRALALAESAGDPCS